MRLAPVRKSQYARRGTRQVGAKEDHHGTRQRYTIMTACESWAACPLENGYVPPKIAVLFKAETGNRRWPDQNALGPMYVLHVPR